MRDVRLRRGSVLRAVLFAFFIGALLMGCARGQMEETPTVRTVEPSPSPTAGEESTPSSVTVIVAPRSGPPGTEIQVMVAGFPPQTDIELGLGPSDAEYDVMVSPRTDSAGALATRLAIPSSAEPGQEWVVVAETSDETVRAVSNPFEVTAAEYDPQVRLSPTSGPPGTEIEVTAEGFPPDEAVEVGLGREDSEYDVVEGLETDADGGLVTGVAVPSSADVDERWVAVVVTEDGSVEAVSNVFQVTEPEVEPRVDISPDEGPPGTDVRVSARGFPPNSAVEIGIGRVDSEYDIIARARTGADGRAETRITVPEFVDPDDRWVIVVATEDRQLTAISDEFDVTTSVTPTPSGFTRTTIYLVAIGDEGQTGEEIGCGDSLVPVEIEIEPTLAPLTAGLNELLSIDTREYGQSGLYNALYQSDLTLESVRIVDSEAVIRLSGTLVLGGACDEPRVWAQLRQTALQYRTVDEVSIFVNDTPLEELVMAPPPSETDGFTQTTIYLVAIGDEGQLGEEIGCGDSLVAVDIEIEPTLAPLTAALNELLTTDGSEYGESGFYNSLYQSDLTLEDVTIVDGEAVISLSGTLTLGGVCDEPRVRAQLRQTALQYATVDEVSILVNDTPLEDLLSQEGG